MIFDLAEAAALLLSLCLLINLNLRLLRPYRRTATLGAGLIFGGIAILGMMMPITVAEGVIFDARTVVISMAGLFGGPVAGLLAALIASAYRIELGGMGAAVGVVSIFASLALGLFYRYAIRRAWASEGFVQYLAFGLAVHLTVLALFTLLPREFSGTIFGEVALPFLIVLTLTTGLVGLLLKDIEDRFQTEGALVESEAHLRAITRAIPDVLFVIGENERYLNVMTPEHRLLPTPATALAGRHIRDVLPAAEARLFSDLIHRTLQRKTTQGIEYSLDTLAGERCTFEGRCQPLDAEVDHQRAVLFLARDITEHKRSEASIRRLALYDHLTGLPNRRLLTDRLERAIASSDRHGTQGALIFIDLDDFKNINDLLGHHNGDILLRHAAKRLCDSVRQSDTVARLGGDEFIILLESLSPDPQSAKQQAESIASKALRAMQTPYLLDGRQRASNASFGIAIFGGHAQTADELMKQADLSMYEAKREGKSRIRVYTPSMQENVVSRLKIEDGIREGIAAGQFSFLYQPQVSAHTGLLGAEVLMRWQHPEKGSIHPDLFIPIAEQAGLMHELGLLALSHACRQLAHWSRRIESAHLTLAVNISAQQLYHPDFVASVQQALAESDAPADHLVLELTESLLLEDMEMAIERMNTLRKRGVRFSIDDFGTGYSSLAYLNQLPLDELKIDRTFVQDIPRNENNLAIVKAIIALADTLSLRVIAEGVEFDEQGAALLGCGCERHQGYLHGRPMPPQQFAELIGLP